MSGRGTGPVDRALSARLRIFWSDRYGRPVPRHGVVMLRIAGGVILGVLGLVLLSRMVDSWTARGHTVMGGVAWLLTFVVGGAVGLYTLALVITHRNNAQWKAFQGTSTPTQTRPLTPAEWDAIPASSPHGNHPGLTHAAWCATWAGTAVPDSLCAPWTIDTAPPALLGATVSTHARRRLADSLVAASEIGILSREVSATRLEAAEILPAWNRWARTHRRADAFGRFQAARLVEESCKLGQPHHDNLDAESRSLSGHLEWCYRSWWADSTIFAASAPMNVTPR
jgi:hypothetical protein